MKSLEDLGYRKVKDCGFCHIYERGTFGIYIDTDVDFDEAKPLIGFTANKGKDVRDEVSVQEIKACLKTYKKLAKADRKAYKKGKRRPFK